MTAKPYDAAIFMGRFQPPHNGHLAVLRHAAALADLVVVLIGSAKRPRSVKNPFSYDERRAMISAAAARDFAALGARLETRPLVDTIYDDDAWVANVRRLAEDAAGPDGGRVCLTGYEKDDSSYYLKLFPEWPYEGAPPTYDAGAVLNATDIRAALFEAADVEAALAQRAPQEVAAQVAALRSSASQDWARLQTEKAAVAREKQRLQAAADAYGGAIRRVHVALAAARGDETAMILRAEPPGQGLCALPTAAPEAGETLAQTVQRLAQMHSLEIGALSAPVVYDHPDRSETGPAVLAAFYAEAAAGGPEIIWTPTHTPPRVRIFADHVDVMQGVLRR